MIQAIGAAGFRAYREFRLHESLRIAQNPTTSRQSGSRWTSSLAWELGIFGHQNLYFVPKYNVRP